jgi:hypothetical protein
MENMDTWLTAKVFTNRWEDKVEVIRRFISPIVKEIEKETWFKTFHFLSYGNPGEGFYLRFRINICSNKKEYLKEVLDSKKEEVNRTSPLILSIDYTEPFVEKPDVLKSEQRRFGVVGWNIFLKYFEYVSRTIIQLLERPEIESSAYPIKYRMTSELFHFLLNPLLYPSFDGNGETTAHIQAICERYATLISVLIEHGASREDAINGVLGTYSLIREDLGLKFSLVREKL